jgi:hypothetical protein
LNDLKEDKVKNLRTLLANKESPEKQFLHFLLNNGSIRISQNHHTETAAARHAVF